nr:Spermine/spermidine synthase family protein [Haemonchus contortus]
MSHIIPLACSTTVLLLSFFIARLWNETILTNNVVVDRKNITESANMTNIQKKEMAIRKRLLSNPYHKLDELCSELDQTCFVIADKVEEYNGKLMAFRSLRRKGPQGVLTLSDARILPPSPLTWDNFNTKTWKIDKRTVRLEYARLMVVGAFFSGALEFNTTRKQDVLLIGLGGGIINNYFTTLPNHTIAVTVVDIDPVMKRIAEKWYDFHESANHQIVIEDGVRFVRDAARKGVKYDAILLDVCYNVPRSMMCPIDEFLSDDVIEAMKAVTSENGAVIVNIITTRDRTDEADRVHFLFSRHFPSCYLMADGRIDRMLFCSAKEKNSWLDNRDELYNRYIAVDAALGFQLTLRKKFIPNDLL